VLFVKDNFVFHGPMLHQAAANRATASCSTLWGLA
jgi:hypothetical protein